MCIAVLRLLLTKYNEGAGLKVVDEKGNLPVHIAARRSTLDVVDFLLQAYPESVHEIAEDGENLIHVILGCDHVDKVARVQYLCDRSPGLLSMKNDVNMTPLQDFIIHRQMDLSMIAIMCQADETVLSEICTNNYYSRMLPLHLILICENFESCVSGTSDIFRLILRFYPAAVGVRDSQDRNAYDLAISDERQNGHNIDFYFVRLLLSIDQSIAPETRLHLNHNARREALFLSYRALSSNREPIIWVKLRHESRDLLRHTMSYL
jgi:ankyrin repeat protein